MTIALATSVLACAEAETRGSLVVGEGRDVGVLLPVIETSALDGEINSMLYSSLNQAFWENGTLVYRVDGLSLAERYELGGPDSAVLTYTLRSNATWSDGQPIDADDVAFTFELVRRPEIGSAHAAAWEHLDSVTVVDERTVSFHFARRYPGMLFDTGIGIIPEHVFAGSATSGEALAGHPALGDPSELVVSGPYRVADWRPGDRLVLEANARSLIAPATDTVIFRVLPDETTRLVELENGELDMAGPVPIRDAERLAADPAFRVEAIEDRFYDYIAWNPERFPPFADPVIRRALSLAIDRQAVLEGLGIDRYSQPAGGPYPPIFERLADPEVRPDPYLPDSARALLAAAGWRDGDGDGVLDREGRRFRFTLLTQAANRRRTSAAEIIQEGYAEAGIDMQIRTLEFNSLLGRVFEERAFDAVLLGWQVALEPDYLVGHFWPRDHPFNITGYASPRLDSIIPLAEAAATSEEAAPHWRAAARVIAEERPYAFLWFFDDLVVVNERVKGTRIDTYGLYQNLHEWRIEE